MEKKTKVLIATDKEGHAVFLDDSFELIRENFKRFNSHLTSYVPLKEMSDDWLEQVIAWYLDIRPEARSKQIDDWALCLYIREKQYRNYDLEDLNVSLS